MRDETLIQLYLIYEILMEEPAGYSTRVTGQRKLVRLIGIRRWSLFCFFLVSLAFFWQNTSDSLLLVGLCRKVDTRKVTGRLVRRQRTGSIFVELAKTRSILREKLRACRKSILGAVGSLRKFSVENTVKGLKKNKHCRIFRKFDFGLNLAKTG